MENWQIKQEAACTSSRSHVPNFGGSMIGARKETASFIRPFPSVKPKQRDSIQIRSLQLISRLKSRKPCQVQSIFLIKLKKRFSDLSQNDLQQKEKLTLSLNMTLVVIIVEGSTGSVIPIEIKLTTITSTISNRRTYDRGLLKNTICRWLSGSSKCQTCLRCLSHTFLLNQWHRISKSFHLLVLLQYYGINLGKNFNIIWY